MNFNRTFTGISEMRLMSEILGVALIANAKFEWFNKF